MTATTPRANGAPRSVGTLDFAERDDVTRTLGAARVPGPWPADDEPDPGAVYRDRPVPKAWGQGCPSWCTRPPSRSPAA